MHKHCGLSKWEIWDYTLPQITELMKQANRYIQFEISGKMGMTGMFGNTNTDSSDSDDEFADATEDDIDQLARVLGGG
jgi:hypothetical protein